jgi:hypothetical protein
VAGPRPDHRNALSKSGDYLRQSAALEAVSAGLQERDLRIVTQTAATVFRVRLIGKDCGVMLDRNAPDEAPTLIALIDAITRRRAEISGR